MPSSIPANNSAHSAKPSVVLHDLSFAWPDGAAVLDHVSGVFGRGRTGLLGRNGVGKSTLLRLIAGELAPDSGTISRTGSVDHLPQQLTLRRGATVAGLLGVQATIDAIRAVEAGRIEPELFDAVGDGWDIEERSLAALCSAGITIDRLDRPVATLSGGEAMLAGLVGILLRGAPIALLDEPTNNLDADARERVYALVRGWRGALIVVSHDTALLELMDETAELREGALARYGGPYSVYRQLVDAEQEAARRALRAAEQTLKLERRQRIEAEERIAHSERQGRKDKANRKYVAAVINDRRNSAEKSQGARRGLHEEKVATAQSAASAAEARVRDDDRITIQLPDPQLPAGRRLATLTGSDGRSFILQGPERVALTGPNGAGKTTLLRQLLSQSETSASPSHREPASATGPARRSRPRALAVAATERIGHLSQRLDGLDDTVSVLANVQAAAPRVPAGELRNRLARLLIRGSMVERPAGTLSGGERFRVALAQLLLADPPAQVLLLDEPTNNLDLESVDRLVEALTAYRGALLVVSHDRGFLDRLGCSTELRLDREGRLEERRA